MKQIPLSKGKFAIVDDEDYNRLSGYRYYFHVKGYAMRWLGRNHSPCETYLHHDILGKPPAGMVVDHINRDKLDNRKSNLRFVTRAQNRVNSRKTRYGAYSDYRGAHYHKRLKKWAASIGHGGKLIHLGYFENEHEAALAYNEAAVKYHGEYAKLNEL